MLARPRKSVQMLKISLPHCCCNACLCTPDTQANMASQMLQATPHRIELEFRAQSSVQFSIPVRFKVLLSCCMRLEVFAVVLWLH